MPPVSPNAKDTRPLWQRLLLRRLKFLGVLAALVLLVGGGSYLFAPQWLVLADTKRQEMIAHVDKYSVQVGDTRWVYYEGGQGPTIVLLHGFNASKELWLKLATLLTPHFHVIIPDLPGWGESTRVTDASYNIDAQASRLDAFVNALRLQRFLLVGHSMGGAIAGVYAAEHPEHVSELALIDSFGLKANENEFYRQSMAGKNVFIYDNREQFDASMAWAFTTPPSVPGRIKDYLVQRNINDRAFIQHTFEELRDPAQYLALQSRLDQLTMPVMGLWCHDDKIIDISALDSLRSGLTHASSISSSMLLGCGHMPIMEKPDETARILTQFALSH